MQKKSPKDDKGRKKAGSNEDATKTDKERRDRDLSNEVYEGMVGLDKQDVLQALTEIVVSSSPAYVLHI